MPTGPEISVSRHLPLPIVGGGVDTRAASVAVTLNARAHHLSGASHE